jgi:hypothetical protein
LEAIIEAVKATLAQSGLRSRIPLSRERFYFSSRKTIGSLDLYTDKDVETKVSPSMREIIAFSFMVYKESDRVLFLPTQLVFLSGSGRTSFDLTTALEDPSIEFYLDGKEILSKSKEPEIARVERKRKFLDQFKQDVIEKMKNRPKVSAIRKDPDPAKLSTWYREGDIRVPLPTKEGGSEIYIGIPVGSRQEDSSGKIQHGPKSFEECRLSSAWLRFLNFTSYEVLSFSLIRAKLYDPGEEGTRHPLGFSVSKTALIDNINKKKYFARSVKLLGDETKKPKDLSSAEVESVANKKIKTWLKTAGLDLPQIYGRYSDFLK